MKIPIHCPWTNWHVQCAVIAAHRRSRSRPPTPKQLAYLAALDGGCCPKDAYRAIARVCQRPLKDVMWDATVADASAAITELKRMQDDFAATIAEFTV